MTMPVAWAAGRMPVARTSRRSSPRRMPATAARHQQAWRWSRRSSHHRPLSRLWRSCRTLSTRPTSPECAWRLRHRSQAPKQQPDDAHVPWLSLRRMAAARTWLFLNETKRNVPRALVLLKDLAGVLDAVMPPSTHQVLACPPLLNHRGRAAPRHAPRLRTLGSRQEGKAGGASSTQSCAGKGQAGPAAVGPPSREQGGVAGRGGSGRRGGGAWWCC